MRRRQSLRRTDFSNTSVTSTSSASEVFEELDELGYSGIFSETIFLDADDLLNENCKIRKIL